MNTKDYLIIAVITLVIFSATYFVLAWMGFIPEQFKGSEVNRESSVENNFEYTEENSNNLNDTANGQILYPDRIVIPKIGVDSDVQKPQSQDVAVLDQALTKGAVYYPGSGTISNGNMFIFGHSTNWKVVNNPAYKTFNDLDKLNVGDEINIESNGKTFIYKVKKVTLVDEEEALVSFNKTGKTLTISTCNTFGAKQERWVVDAEFSREV